MVECHGIVQDRNKLGLESKSHIMDNPDCIGRSIEPMLIRSACQYIAKLEVGMARQMRTMACRLSHACTCVDAC